ncbi:MAG: hypothetical protein KKE84_01870 [Gammaproteobacteria bacterium]|nr:hypothetical protein [Gammaproteobacteria bacterium]
MAIATKLQTACAGALLALTPMQGVLGAGLESGDFEGYPVVSNQELAALRGGFELNIGGQLLSLAFSLERVSFLNGELLTRTLITVPDIAAAILSSQNVSVTTYTAPPASGEAAGNPDNPPPQIATVSVPGQDAGSRYVTLIQNGAGNSVALPAQVNQDVSQQVNQQMNQALQAAQAQILQAYNQVTVIQNSLDNQIIQNMTTLNVTLSNAALARAVELNAGLAQVLNMPVVLPQ